MAGPKKAPAERVEARSTLTAVLLADSFTQRFRPITIERPKVLLPLVNVPMLEYTLEWLAMNKVEETYVFCCAHAEQIKAYLADSKWGPGGHGYRQMKVHTIVSTVCSSAGEALRMVDQRDIIKSDFVLVSGDTVSNMKLAPVLEAHRARRAADKNAIMTMVMKAVHHPQQRLRLGDAQTLICMDPATQRLLKYQELEVGARGVTKVDAAFFSERDNVQIRTDLMDTQISICAPEVLMLFSDNFDYQNVKKDFVSGVLSEEELGNKLYIAELAGEYAAHVHNLRSFDAISRDVVQRWAFPFVPDTHVLAKGGAWGAASYRYGRGHVYCEAQVQAARSAVLESDVCVGAGTSIGEQTVISQSVIGRDCRIGKNVTIIGSYIHDNVTIQDNAVLRSALVCENALVKQGALVEPGAIISFGVVIGQGHRVAANKRLSLCQQIAGVASLSDDELEYASGPQHGVAAAARREHAAQTTAAAGTSTGAAHAHLVAGGGSDDDDDDDSEIDDEEYEAAGKLGQSIEKPSAAAMSAAAALAKGRPQDVAGAQRVEFDEAAVGPGGAGFEWRPNEGFDVERLSIAVPDISKMRVVESEVDLSDVAAAGARGGDEEEEEHSGDDDDEDTKEEFDPEVYFKREVSATVLRAIKERIDEENVKLELNGLKIAQDKTFADCARYIFTTLLCLGLPAAASGLGFEHRHEFASLFPKVAANMATQEGKATLLTTFKKQIARWGKLLRQFLKNDDDQLELLLTFEDYCSEEGVFKTAGAQGAPYGEIFVNVLQELYDSDVLSEEALLEWADQKEQDDEEDQVYLRKATKFIEWLRNAEEDEEEDDEDDSDEDEDE